MVVAHAFNLSPGEAEKDVSLSPRTDRSMEQVPGEPGLYKETLWVSGGECKGIILITLIDVGRSTHSGRTFFGKKR